MTDPVAHGNEFCLSWIKVKSTVQDTGRIYKRTTLETAITLRELGEQLLPCKDMLNVYLYKMLCLL